MYKVSVLSTFTKESVVSFADPTSYAILYKSATTLPVTFSLSLNVTNVNVVLCAPNAPMVSAFTTAESEIFTLVTSVDEPRLPILLPDAFAVTVPPLIVKSFAYIFFAVVVVDVSSTSKSSPPKSFVTVIYPLF